MSAKGDFCPLIQKKCVEDKCKFWIHLRGANPQSGADMDFPDCSIKWLPVLLIENSQMSRQTGAAVESFRNVVAEGQNHTTRALLALKQVAEQQQ